MFDAAFKAYDIRGNYPQQVNEELAFALGANFAERVLSLGQTQVLVGRDGRLSSLSLAQQLIKGLRCAGVQVLDLGLVTSPLLYFACCHYAPNGIVVTASHNPKEDNGFKLMLDGQALFGEQLQQFKQQMHFDTPTNAALRGAYQTMDILPQYQNELLANIRLARRLKLVIDCGNGVAGASAEQLFQALGCDTIALFTEVDGNFPNHHPDPSKAENLIDLQQAVLANSADLGVAFDGDADRLGVVTSSGEIIVADQLLMLFATAVLAQQNNAKIVFDIKCSQAVGQLVRQLGGEPILCRTGHSYLKAAMRQHQAALAGEFTGHFFFADRWYGFDDAYYAAARLLELIAAQPADNDVFSSLPATYQSTPELNLACPSDNAHELVKMLIDLIQQTVSLPPEASVTIIDGLRIDWADGFALIRASNTTPTLGLRFEGKTAAILKRIQLEVEGWLRQLPLDFPSLE